MHVYENVLESYLIGYRKKKEKQMTQRPLMLCISL